MMNIFWEIKMFLTKFQMKGNTRCVVQNTFSETLTPLQIMRVDQAGRNGTARIISIICYCNTVRPTGPLQHLLSSLRFRLYSSSPLHFTYQHLLTSAGRRQFTDTNIGLSRCQVMQITIFKYYSRLGCYS